MSDLLELAADAERKGISSVKYALNSPPGYDGQAAAARAASAQWFAIAAALRALASGEKK